MVTNINGMIECDEKDALVVYAELFSNILKLAYYHNTIRKVSDSAERHSLSKKRCCIFHFLNQLLCYNVT